MSSLVERFLTPHPPAATSLAALQQRMMQRMLLLMLGICVVLGSRDVMVGYSFDTLPAVTGVCLAGLAAYRFAPRARFMLPLLAVLAVLWAVVGEMRTSGDAVTPASVFLLASIPLVTLMSNVAGAWAVTLLTAALVLGQQWRHPPLLAVQRQSVNDLLVLLFAGQVVAWIFQRSFWRLQLGLTRQQRALEALEQENQALARPLFLLLASSLERLEALLGAPGPVDPAPLPPLVDEIQAALHQARAVALGSEALPAPAAEGDPFLATRSAFNQVGAWSMAVVVSLSAVPALFGGAWAVPNTLDVVAGLLMLAYLMAFGTRRFPKLTVWALLLPEFLAVCYRVYYWGPSQLSPATPELPVLVLIVGLAAGYRSALAVTAMGVTLLVAAWLGGHPAAVRLDQDLNVFLALLLALFGAGQVLGLHGRLSAALGSAVHGQERRLDRRRRILGLLFQDLLHPLSLLSINLEQAEGGFGPELRERLLAQVRRLRALLRATQPVLGDHAGEPQLAPLRLARCLRGVKAALEPALVLRGQRLYVDCPDELRALSVGELLDAGVLMPLLLNAIQHNPDGASVTLRAREHGGQVSLWISDQGPGFSDAVLQALAQGRPVPHASIEQRGDPGAGLGLDRAWDYAGLLGGSLNIYNRVEGGAVAQVLLPLAADEGAPG